MKTKLLKENDTLLIKRIFKYLKRYKIKYLMVLLCTILGIIFGLLQPLIWAKLLTNLFSRDYSQLIIITGYFVILFFSQSIFDFFKLYLFSFLNENLVYDLKKDIYDKILNLPIRAFDEISVGEIFYRVNSDTMAVANIITNQFISTITEVFRILIIGFAVFSISIPLSIIVIFSSPLSLYIFLVFGKKIRGENKALASISDCYSNNLQQSILGIREIRSLGIKDNRIKLLLFFEEKIRSKKIKISVMNSLSQTLAQGNYFISQVVLIAVGGFLLSKGMIKIEYFIAFMSYSNQFSMSLLNIARVNSYIQQILTSLERIFKIIDSFNYSEEQFGNKNIENISGNIRFQNVSFKYEDKFVLENISFEIEKNKKVALVGVSGSGKSTIFNLILRFYQPTKGSILMDDINIEELDEESLRTHIAIVHQQPFMFNLTIKENLLLANSKAEEEEIFEACKLAYIHDYIISLPLGYDTVIEGEGINFSRGQVQRIAIARALLKKSKIILFDEATASLDNDSQDKINKALDIISENHTIIIIAHRLFTIFDADNIIVIDDGKISGQGTHENLINSNRIYRELYKKELDTFVNNFA